MQAYIDDTKRWIEKMVIGLNLCPFAKVPFQQDKIRYIVCLSHFEEELFQELLSEIDFLVRTPAAEVETTLVIFPNQANEFMDYLDLLADAGNLLLEAGLEGILQIASFHPNYRFAYTEQDAAGNYTNRSPYPMFHLLREDSVERVLETYPSPEKIPNRNIRRLQEMGIEGILELLKKDAP